ncbi:LuxR family transcriptional regulator [Nocardioides sp. W7]|uniref:ATP-binding protein n=1 Tax=Nocardioides sp. W7 TaxID=2931390 RepID=UPI001FD2F13D|nr:LuxR family transcriptional regulator [Nocardioides sp. W7]
MLSRTAVLERDDELAALARAARLAAGGAGSVVLVSGEAGIGKSSLVGALHDALPDARLLTGRCDDLATPRVLGPLRDLSGTVGADLARALRSPGERDALFTALHEELDWAGHATVLTVEDVHWADEATLDLLRWLARRVSDLPAVLVLTYRDDELDRAHPLRRLLAAIATARSVVRLPLGPLSSDAVRTLAGPGWADTVLAATGGNPFLVHELLASPDAVPSSVVDLVLARLHRLDPDSRDAVERLSVITSTADRPLVDALVPGGLAALAGAEEHGLLLVEPRQVGFRHELTRRAVVDALPAARRTTLNAAALAVLEARPDHDPAQLVHHAIEAGDAVAVVRHGPAAATAAATGRAHRQAADHLRAVLAHRDELAPPELADLLEASARACYTVGDRERSALADQDEAVRIRRDLGDPVALGASLRSLSRIAWWVGDRRRAETAAVEAVSVLGGTEDRRELALALSNVSQLAMLAERMTEARETAEHAIALAREVDDRAVLSHALNNLGTAQWAQGDPTGRELVEESRDVALEAGLSEHASRAWCNVVWQLLVHLRPDEAGEELVAGIEHAEADEQVVFWKYLTVERGLVALAGARWATAVADAEVGLDATSPIRCTALFVLGRVALRTGEPADELVEECWRLGRELDELQRTAPAAALACEAAWLRRDDEQVRRIGREVYAEACRVGSLPWRVELAHWLRLAGDPVDPADLAGSTHPHALSARGDWRGAADAWAAAGYPYEAAAALTCSDDDTVVLSGLAGLDALGGVRLADRVREDLRRRGAVRVPRGPTSTTRVNVAGLTARQVDVLALLAEGLPNAAIAERLVLSVRTVDHHVGALMAKLGAGSRHEAVERATELGWSAG